MNRSDQINELLAALSKAQKTLKNAAKDSANPFFKSKYADLTSVWDACRDALADNDLSVIQTPTTSEGGVLIETMLGHSSGQWVSEKLELPVQKDDAQGIGSAITYARRYALASMVGVAPEDDDGNAAATARGNGKVAAQNGNGKDKMIRDMALSVLQNAAKKGVVSLEEAWKEVGQEGRVACKNDLAALKKQAMEVGDAAE